MTTCTCTFRKVDLPGTRMRHGFLHAEIEKGKKKNEKKVQESRGGPRKGATCTCTCTCRERRAPLRLPLASRSPPAGRGGKTAWHDLARRVARRGTKPSWHVVARRVPHVVARCGTTCHAVWRKPKSRHDVRHRQKSIRHFEQREIQLQLSQLLCDLSSYIMMLKFSSPET